MVLKLALAQRACVLNDKDKNIEIIAKTVEESQADMAVFGELFLTGYMCRDNLTKLAEPIDGKSVNKIKKIAEEHDTHIVFGMPESAKMTTGLVYNTAALVYPDGKVEKYRKLHLANFGPFEEHLYFAKGGKVPVFETRFGKLGMLICFDCFFPELPKIYALKGADLLVHISASPSATRVFFEKIMVARAIENTVFFTFTNLVGTELNMVFWGGNAVIDPRGEPVAKGEYFKEQVVECEIDLKDLKVAREYRPTIRETRVELFSELQKLLEDDVRGNLNSSPDE
jgi:predicted amidohydrolase